MLLIIEKETIIELARLMGGEESANVMKILLKKPGIVDEEIASRLKMDIRDVRKILHRLNEIGILHYELARDKETEHRVFKWYVQEEQISGFILTNMKKILDRLREKLESERNSQYYWCGVLGHPRLLFDEAMERFFRCPTCGNPLLSHDNEELIKALEWKLREIERALEEMTRFKKIEEIEQNKK
ncbi:MAG: hypothetical protein N3F65_01610 [Nitrososphaeria archaeon]|nr:hypothetical protein [Nitrososphaeria archaeon]MDW8021425.1 hypothetical protein [Nitrososphaerota archaeon]